MLSPEIWKFNASESKFKVETTKLDSPSCKENIQNFFYPHLVSVVLPDTLQVSKTLSNILSVDCEYYKISGFSIAEFVNTNFINIFIKKGYLTALTINTRIDCDDCICVTPKGLIVLSLTKDTYQTLGLQGRLSHFCQRSQERYIVQLDLLKDYFKPGKKNYERTKLCLERLKRFTVLINWSPHRDDICPSSIAKYFHDLNYEVKTCIPNFRTRTNYSVKLPSTCNLKNAHEFVEWLGAFSMQADLESGCPDNYLTTYETPEPSTQCGQVKFLQWKGFFMANQIEKLFKTLLEYMDAEQKPWVSLYVQGFSDSPIVWNFQENRYLTNGDNSYVIVINSTNCLLYKHMCSQKYYKHL